MLRRQSGRANPLFQKGSIEFDLRNGRVMENGFPIDLTAQEVAVLTYLVHNVGAWFPEPNSQSIFMIMMGTGTPIRSPCS